MSSCWKEDPTERISFAEVVDGLEKEIEAAKAVANPGYLELVTEKKEAAEQEDNKAEISADKEDKPSDADETNAEDETDPGVYQVRVEDVVVTVEGTESGKDSTSEVAARAASEC